MARELQGPQVTNFQKFSQIDLVKNIKPQGWSRLLGLGGVVVCLFKHFPISEGGAKSIDNSG